MIGIAASHRGLKANGRYGSKADIAAPPTNVCFTPKSGHGLTRSWCPLCARSSVPEADMCSARLVSANGQRWKSFQGLLGWQIGHWRSRYRVFDHRGGRRGLRLDPDIIGEAKPTAARSAADLSAPKRGRRPAIRPAVNHL